MNEGNNGSKTRGRPFAKGNSGRPKGARTQGHHLGRAIAGVGRRWLRSVVKAAKRGNMVAAKIVLDRLAPPTSLVDLPRGTRPKKLGREPIKHLPSFHRSATYREQPFARTATRAVPTASRA